MSLNAHSSTLHHLLLPHLHPPTCPHLRRPFCDAGWYGRFHDALRVELLSWERALDALTGQLVAGVALSRAQVAAVTRSWAAFDAALRHRFAYKERVVLPYLEERCINVPDSMIDDHKDVARHLSACSSTIAGMCACDPSKAAAATAAARQVVLLTFGALRSRCEQHLGEDQRNIYSDLMRTYLTQQEYCAAIAGPALAALDRRDAGFYAARLTPEALAEVCAQAGVGGVGRAMLRLHGRNHQRTVRAPLGKAVARALVLTQCKVGAQGGNPAHGTLDAGTVTPVRLSAEKYGAVAA